jgi:hypothetical protein
MYYNLLLLRIIICGIRWWSWKIVIERIMNILNKAGLLLRRMKKQIIIIVDIITIKISWCFTDFLL